MFWVYDSDTFYARTKRGQQLVRKHEDLLARVHAARWDKLAKYLYLGSRGCRIISLSPFPFFMIHLELTLPLCVETTTTPVNKKSRAWRVDGVGRQLHAVEQKILLERPLHPLPTKLGDPPQCQSSTTFGPALTL